LTWGNEGNKLGPCQDKRDGAEVRIHRGVGGAVSGDDDILGEPHGETGGGDGVGCVGQVISIYPYAPHSVQVASDSAGPVANQEDQGSSVVIGGSGG